MNGNTRRHHTNEHLSRRQHLAETPLPDKYSPVPPNGKRCEFCGLGHSRLYQLLDGPAKPFVRVASLRQPGKKRGTRLFHVGDLLRYLDGLAVDQAADLPNNAPEVTDESGLGDRS